MKSNILKLQNYKILSVYGCLCFFAVNLFSCSSSEKRNETGAPITIEDVSIKSKPNVEESKKKAIEVAPVEKPAPEREVPPSLSQKLSEAIKNQSDEEIYKISGQILLDSPNDLKALNSMAAYQYKKGRFSAAEYLLKKAIQNSSPSAAVYSNLGLIQLAQKDEREAIHSFKKALEISSDDPVASANLGGIYVENKDYAKAIIVLENPYKKGWKDPKVLNNYAVALMANKKYEKAEGIYKDLLSQQSSQKEVLLNYAILQIDHLKKYQDGLETLNRLKFIGVPPDSKKRVSQLEFKAKNKGQEK